jgi:hypothetical protein
MLRMKGEDNYCYQKAREEYEQKTTITMQAMWGDKAPSDKMSLPSFNSG